MKDFFGRGGLDTARCDITGRASTQSYGLVNDWFKFRKLRGSAQSFYSQKISLIPNCAANGMPTVVPGPKKSPKAPAGTRNCL